MIDFLATYIVYMSVSQCKFCPQNYPSLMERSVSLYGFKILQKRIVKVKK